MQLAQVVEEREGGRVCMLCRDLQPLHSTLEMERMLLMEEERNGGMRNIKSISKMNEWGMIE